MRVCIITTNEETFFIPKGINYLISELKGNIDVVCVPGFSSFKRSFYSFFTLYFIELMSIIRKKFINLFKKSIIKKATIKIENINSKKFCNLILEKKYNLLISYSCPQIFNKDTLDFLKKENIDLINFHPGILPKYKGIFINFYSLENKEKEIGITLHKISEKIDSGDILSMLKIPVENKDTVFSLYKKIFLSKTSLQYVKNCIENYDLIKNNKMIITTESNYNSYPEFIRLLKYRLKKF